MGSSGSTADIYAKVTRNPFPRSGVLSPGDRGGGMPPVSVDFNGLAMLDRLLRSVGHSRIHSGGRSKVAAEIRPRAKDDSRVALHPLSFNQSGTGESRRLGKSVVSAEQRYMKVIK